MPMYRRHFNRSLHQALLCCVLVTVSVLARAETPPAAEAMETQEVSSDPLCHFPPARQVPPPDPKVPPDRTQLQADAADMSLKDVTRFSGSVVVQREGRRLEADKATYHHGDENFDAAGNVLFLSGEVEIEAERARMNMKKNRGTMQQTRYRVLPGNASGTAETLTLDGPQRMILSEATYTTCPPDDVAWQLSASEITLDKESRQGTASHVVIDFMGVPFLYLPYLRYPLGDERMSGFLFPTFGTSDERGTEFSVPYYWNIAPEMDATITAHNMTRHGLMWENEFRYLTEQSEGRIELDYLADDKILGTDRRRFRWYHQAQADAGWSSVIDYQEVADKDHLADFGGTLNSSSTTHLEQRATLNYNADTWLFSALAQDFQTLSTPDTIPYRKLPQLTLASRLPTRDNRVNANALSEWVRFDHTDKSKVTAERTHVQPTVSLPLRNQAAYFTPRITGYFTQYQLSENAPQADKTPTRSLAISSLDTGLFLERDTSLAGTPLLQTLEPRLFYVYAPYRDQEDLPIFDSGLTTFSFDSLFRENRFTGTDRIGDTNRLTVALTTRLLHQQTGAELFSASVGRVYYYDDRRVTLPDQAVETANTSDYVARLAASPAPYWSLSSDIQWDGDTEQTRFSTSRISYRRDNDHLLTLGYRYRRDDIATRDIGLIWRLSPRWRFLAGYQYDEMQNRELETVMGVNYDSCCWGLRILAREYYNGTSNGQDLYDSAIYLVLDLKGLSSFGNDTQGDSILRQAIPGYTP